MADTSQHHSYAQARDPMGRFAFADSFDARLADLIKVLAPQAQAEPQQMMPTAQSQAMNALRQGMMGTQSGAGEGVENFLARHGVNLSQAYGVKP